PTSSPPLSSPPLTAPPHPTIISDTDAKAASFALRVRYLFVIGHLLLHERIRLAKPILSNEVIRARTCHAQPIPNLPSTMFKRHSSRPVRIRVHSTGFATY